MKTQAQFVDHIECLPPLPTVVQRLLAVTESADTSAGQVARVLAQDPGVAAKVLRVANSPFYGASREVTQVSRAVVMLGARAVRSLVLGICARETMMTLAPHTVEHARLWQHAIATAAAGELLARQAGFQPTEEAFVAGLLHDIGQLAMAAFRPELFRQVVSEYLCESGRLARQREAFGVDHAEAGYRILSRWGLPEPLCRVARFHHLAAGPDACAGATGRPGLATREWSPANAAESKQQRSRSDIGGDRLLALVVLANGMAHVAGFGLDTPPPAAAAMSAASQLLNLSPSAQARVFASLDRRVSEAAQTLAATQEAQLTCCGPDGQRTAVWAAATTDGPADISAALLERCGYQVRRVRLAECCQSLLPEELVVIEDDRADGAAAGPSPALGPERETSPAAKLAQQLVQMGHRRVLLLGEPGPGEALRQYDPSTGVCRVPKVFTVFDLKWAEERLPP